MKRVSIVVGLSLLLIACGDQQPRGRDAGMDGFVTGLMAKMTLEEKLGQLNLPAAGDIVTGQSESGGIVQKIKEGKVGGLFNIKGVDKIREMQRLAVEESRLGIPMLFGMDVIHGYETVFPIPLGLSCSWDMDAIEQSARIAAKEASADGICWTFSPMVDISRDPRWGRVSEGNGEDPFIGSAIAQAMVKGYQGADLADPSSIMSCVKHFALYGAGEAGRDYNTVDMSRVRMYNEYLPPYKAAVEAGVGSVMASFNEIDGVPATTNRWLLTDVLRDQWGFYGFVVSDYTGVSEMIAHGIGNLQAVSARALSAGLDMDMVSEGLINTLPLSLNEGTINEIEINRACRRILEAKYKLGLFDDPYRYCDTNRPATDIYTPEHRTFARRLAAESFVLLKNDNNTLPLKKQGTVAVIGPLGDTGANMPGTWSVAANLQRTVSLVDGLRETLGEQVKVLQAKGSNLCADADLEKNATLFGRDLVRDTRPEEMIIREALDVARNADVIIAAVGESSEMSGESSSRVNLEIPDTQQRLLQALAKTGKPVVVVLFTGRPLTLIAEANNPQLPAILNVWFGGSEAAYAIADVLFGDVNPCGKLTTTFPQHVGQIPLYYNHKQTGRPLDEGATGFQKFRSNYLDVSNDPLYPFGYGLSYTQFTYGKVMLSAESLSPDGSLTATTMVTNSGTVAGKEIVQLYIRDRVGSVTRPVKELKGFQKIALEPGESREVRFRITPELLKFYNYDLEFVAEPGEFEVQIGTNSRDVQKATFNLQ